MNVAIVVSRFMGFRLLARYVEPGQPALRTAFLGGGQDSVTRTR
ncbi:hypothetical protein BN13_1050008 [Nostocoides jenkinsii Ben 74]|uniref:Uncharacterized protein n=1 Tax=Nostocoides jenkinsii Ben 74 TaxID=1193518 RepID=A0A077M9L4_9MICO|nr:hypothetical protein BN13_1050008 [Tetrasphaera jenkinsii Ben 74]